MALSVYVKKPNGEAKACIIWMHGLGADASDMMGLAEELNLNNTPIRHVFLDAPSRPVTFNGGMVMSAWYDITGADLANRVDKAGIAESAAIINDAITAQCDEGFNPQQIYLAGFSQGGAMALHTALHFKGQLGGVIALSSYLPLGTESRVDLEKSTPFFLALGQFDPLVRPEWSRMSAQWLKIQGFATLDVYEYPMEHSVCHEEIRDLSQWLLAIIGGEAS